MSTNSVASIYTGAAQTWAFPSGYEAVALSWSAPTQTGGTPITGYCIRYSTDGGGSWVQLPNTGSTSTSLTVTGLTSQAGYIFEVAAINAAGTLSAYQIECQVGSGTDWIVYTASTGTTATQQLIVNLVNGTSYRFRVAAITQLGVGVSSRATVDVIPFTVPGHRCACSLRRAVAGRRSPGSRQPRTVGARSWDATSPSRRTASLGRP